MATSSEPNLSKLLEDPGFTPSVKMLGGLVELMSTADDDVVKQVERAIARIDLQQSTRVVETLSTKAKESVRPLRGRLTAVVGRFVQNARDPEGVGLKWLLDAVTDDDIRTRRSAAQALGKIPESLSMVKKELVRSMLGARFDLATNADDKKVLAEALGKLGGEGARRRLEGTKDHVRAALMIDRESARKESGSIDPKRTHDGPLRVWFHTRSGLEDVLKEEIAEKKCLSQVHFVSPGIVEAELAHKTPLSEVLSIRTATHVGFPLASIAKSEDLAVDVVSSIVSPASMKVFYAFTSSAADKNLVRFRLEFVRGGHRRSLVWRCAELVRSEMRDLINDPKAATWEVVVDDASDRVKVELVPRAVEDRRFEYRQDTVAASSHPVIASALVRVAPFNDDDVVWDPFVGAGAEIIERGLRGAFGRLIGTDVDVKALEAATANLERAGLAKKNVTLTEADASTFQAKAINVIITNPPMGRRVQRGGHADLLERFVEHASKVLEPGGSLVWLVPEPKRIRDRAEASNLELERAFTVDMGGFSAELQVWRKGRRTGTGSGKGNGSNERRETSVKAVKQGVIKRPNRKR